MRGIYDIHCHALPGVDDGAKSLSESLQILQMERDDGVEHVLLTPHYRRGMFETDRHIVQKQFAKLQEACTQKLPELQLSLGCEFHSNMDMTDQLQEEPAYRLCGSRTILLEFSSRDSRDYIRGRVYEAVRYGYRVIIAHPERYPAMQEDLDFTEDVMDIGARLQINADSILGEDGRRVKKYCKQLLKYEMADFIGSDAHNCTDRPTRLGECAAWIEKKMGRAAARRLLIDNPEKLLQDCAGGIHL